jgi:anti-sigma regulatory factor (Ser/Thr protein kinase)
MEVIRSSHHTAFPVDDASRVGEARRHAAQLALQAGLDETGAGRLALVVTELGTNLLRHAQRGMLLLAVRPQAGVVEVLAIDSGPGIADLPRSLADGYSTGGTPGTGLGAVRRLAHDFDIHSSVPGGTVVLARVGRADAAPAERTRAATEAAGVSVPLAGEPVCGDAWAAVPAGEAQATLVVADGLGHGIDAGEAAQAALDVLAARPEAAPAALLQAMHLRLRGTRGAALTIVHADTRSGRLRASGAGNVAVRVVSGAVDRHLAMPHGTAGVQLRRADETLADWPEHALVVVHSDGISARWPSELLLPVLGRDPALAAALLFRDHARERDDATVAVLRRGR